MKDDIKLQFKKYFHFSNTYYMPFYFSLLKNKNKKKNKKIYIYICNYNNDTEKNQLK